MKKYTKTVIASFVVAAMVFSMTSCSLMGGKSNEAITEAAEEYFSKVVAGKDVSKLVEKSKKDSDEEESKLSGDQEKVLDAILDSAEFKVTEAEGNEKDEEGEATVEFMYVDAEDLAEDAKDIKDLLDAIEDAEDKETKEFTIEFVLDDEDWLVSSKSNKKVQEFILGLVDEIGDGEEPTEPTETTEETTAEITEATEVTTEETTEATEITDETEVTDETEITDETDVTDETEPTDETTAPAPSGDINYANFDDMSFTINGKKYTLGKVTLQEMIDDGVPFDKDDIANAGNNLNDKYTASFHIVLGEYWKASVDVINDSGAAMKASECVVYELYMPMEKDEKQNVITLNFPENVTVEQIIAANGEPEGSDRYHNEDNPDFVADYLTYKKKTSKKYMNQSYFKYEFYNNELRYFYMSLIPG